MSLYHLAKQNDGLGWMLFRLDRIGSHEATVICAQMTEESARELLESFRGVERTGSLSPPYNARLSS